ncbi:hypothetical protein KAZ57_02405 [Patescibacteria group bacterium]|nr:hypothetical protein [Patescibacteria group bacterium]
MENLNKFAMGLWKFSNRIPEQELVELATEWAKDENYVSLYVRGTSKDQNGIGFAYKTLTKEEYDAYFDRTSDMLKRKFGNDLAGWDVGFEAIPVKGF